MTPKSVDFSEKCFLQASCSIWAALPGAQHLERCFASKDVFHMTRRAFLSSKSNTGAGEIEFKMACQKVIKIDHKNEDISESVNSIDSGAIF